VKSELLLNLQLILGTGLLILLGVFTFVLINRIRQRRAQIINLKSSEPSFPFPQRLGAALEGEMLSQARAKREELISAAYAHWLESFFLPDAEPGRAFVRTGVAKHWLRYQLTTTSLAQAAGMLTCVLQAGADPQAQTRFDALLAFCLSRPSLNNPDLMSWQVMPDVVPGARLDADPRAEAWLAFALLCAAAQWKRSSRFDYTQLATQRLDALLAWINSGGSRSRIISPAFARLFQDVSAKEEWLKFADLGQGQTGTIPARVAETAASEAEVQLALLALARGMLPELAETTTEQPILESEFHAKLTHLNAGLEESGANASDQKESFSRLSLLACYAADASESGDAELSQEYWELLSQTNAQADDGLGATFRLIALMALNGNSWFTEAFTNPSVA